MPNSCQIPILREQCGSFTIKWLRISTGFKISTGFNSETCIAWC